MSRALIVINGAVDRTRASAWCAKAPTGTRIEFKASKRTLPQNDRFWAMLGDVSTQLKWHGQQLKASDWRLLFLEALKRELPIVPNLDGTGFVTLKQSSSDLTKDEMSNLIELIGEFGARHGVVFQDERETA